jgi:hypothetical protein
MAEFPGNISIYSIAFTIGVYGYICTGMDGQSNYQNEFWRYDSREDRWEELDDLGFAKRRGVAAFEIDNCGYIVSGKNEDLTRNSDTWQYCIQNDTSINISVFPNPATTYIQLVIIERIPKVYSVQLIDVLGRLNYNSGLVSHAKIIDTKSLSSGVYFLTMYDENNVNVWQSKVVIN